MEEGKRSSVMKTKKKKSVEGQVMDGSDIMELVGNEKVFSSFVDHKFEELDRDCDGKLSVKELQPAVADIGVALGLPAQGSAPDSDHIYSEPIHRERTTSSVGAVCGNWFVCAPVVFIAAGDPIPATFSSHPSRCMVTTRSMASHHNAADHQTDLPNPNNPPQYFTELTNSIIRMAEQNQALIKALLQGTLPIPPPPPPDILPNPERAPGHTAPQPNPPNLGGLQPPHPHINPPPPPPHPSIIAPAPEREASSIQHLSPSGGDNISLWDAELCAMKLQLPGVMQNIQHKPLKKAPYNS